MCQPRPSTRTAEVAVVSYNSRWESLSEAADRVMKSTGVPLEQARSDLCKAMSDGDLDIRAKLDAHATRLQTSTVTVIGADLQIPTRLRPDDIDWVHSRPKQPWPLPPLA